MTDTNLTDNQTTDITALPPAERALIVLNSTKTEVVLRELVTEAANITAVVDAAGREQAHRLGMKLKNARTTIEKTGKAAREDATAFSKSVIDEEKRLKAITEAEEKRVLGLRDEYDAKIAAEKAAKEAAEKARKDEIMGKIEGIRRLSADLAGESAKTIGEEYDALAAFKPESDVFQEFTEEAQKALDEALQAIGALHSRVLEKEQAEAAAEAERIRLEEATRAEREALARERAAVEAERAAIAKERAELEALRAAAKQEPQKFDGGPLGSVMLWHAPGPNGMTPLEGQIQGDTPIDHDAEASLGDKISTSFASNGSIAAPDQPEQEQIDESELMPVVDVTPEQAAEIFEEAEIDPAPAPVVTDFKIRMAALATADQFDAIAAKVSQCGQQMFANDLRQVAITLRAGTFDQALAMADHEALIAADNLLIDASMKFIDAMTEQSQAA